MATAPLGTQDAARLSLSVGPCCCRCPHVAIAVFVSALYVAFADASRSLLSLRSWFDKSITLVVFTDGHAGMNAEHSFADAPVVAHLFECAMIVAEKTMDMYDRDGHIKVMEPTAAKGCTSRKSATSLVPWKRCVESFATAPVLDAAALRGLFVRRCTVTAGCDGSCRDRARVRS